MLVGIYDYDFFNKPMEFPNIECMKLCRYHNRHNDFVTLLPNLDNANKYTKVIVRQDYKNSNNILFNNESNIEYGGLYINNGIYQPLPLEQEKCTPNTDIYLPYAEHYLQYTPFKKDRELWTYLMTGEHHRLSLDGKTVWKDFNNYKRTSNKPKAIIIHDRDLLNINDAFYIIKDLHQFGQRTGTVINKYPTFFETTEQLNQWKVLFNKYLMFSVGWQGTIPKEAVNTIISLSLGEKKHYLPFYYKIPAIFTKSEFYNEILPKVYNYECFFYKYRIKILLIIDDISANYDIVSLWCYLLRNYFDCIRAGSLMDVAFKYKHLFINISENVLSEMIKDGTSYNPDLPKILDRRLIL